MNTTPRIFRDIELGDKPQVPTTHPLELELAQLLNRHSADNDANTPDYILSQFMFTCLSAYKNALRQREKHNYPDSKYKRIAELISSIYFYGNFRAETNAERQLESLLIEVGLWPTTEDDIVKLSQQSENK